MTETDILEKIRRNDEIEEMIQQAVEQATKKLPCQACKENKIQPPEGREHHG